MTPIRDSNPQAPRVSISFSDDKEFDPPELRSITAPPEPPDSNQLRDYKITEKIGEGAMAIVYKATQKSTGRTVAIKTLKFVDQNLAERFSREMSIHSDLKHKNIVEAIDCISTSFGRSYFVMEYLHGLTLEEQIEKRGPCKRPHQIASLLGQICDALECAHQQGIVHRDIKPENIILIEENGQYVVKVLDFGVAKIQEDLQRLTKTGVVLGSPAYMSPEQCMGENLDSRSDLYSLGVVAYELITGALPFDGDSAIEVMELHCDPNCSALPISAYRKDLPALAELQKFFDAVLQVDRANRPASIVEFKALLHNWWNATGAGAPGSVNPFITNQPVNIRPKPARVLDTTEVKSLDKLAGRKKPETSVEEPKRSLLASIPLPVIIVVIIFILIGLSALLAYFLLTALKR
jgi:eukaryotic-like serine/threonine-protein kinase